MIHVYPLRDKRRHVLEGTWCWCGPRLEIVEEGEMLVIHSLSEQAMAARLIEEAEMIKAMTSEEL